MAHSIGVSYGWQKPSSNDVEFDHLTADFQSCKSEIIHHPAKFQELLVRTARQAGLVIVHQYYQTLSPFGSSHLVMVKESHIAAHTWPENRYVSVDVFVCNGKAQEILGRIEDALKPRKKGLIALSRGRSLSVTSPKWFVSRIAPGLDSIFRGAELLHRERSRFQMIEIAEHPRFGRLMFLNGDLQLATSDELIYHSHLVQPVMILHSAPRKVLVIGGGDGGAVREIYRHPGVQLAELIELDSEVVKVCKMLLPTVHRGSLTDRRTKIHYANALGFQYGKNAYDVIIIDLPDPDDDNAQAAYDSRLFHNLSRSLKPTGLLAMNAGSLNYRYGKSWLSLKRLLRKTFRAVGAYAIFVPSFGSQWAFLWASKLEIDTHLDTKVINTAREAKYLPSSLLRTSETIFLS
jgi:spermidine synthase